MILILLIYLFVKKFGCIKFSINLIVRCIQSSIAVFYELNMKNIDNIIQYIVALFYAIINNRNKGDCEAFRMNKPVYQDKLVWGIICKLYSTGEFYS